MNCWACGGKRQQWLKDVHLVVEECSDCGHLFATHETPRDDERDYHLAYNQEAFLESLRATRERQARALVGNMKRRGIDDRFLDYGSGRGFFLAIAREMGIRQLAGADTSPLAVQWLQTSGLASLQIDPSTEGLVPLSTAGFPFVPRVVTFLDVIEHFPGDLLEVFGPWIRDLDPGVEYLAFKVPMREGLLFRTARLLWSLGVPGPLRQLFQVGSVAPHLQYFSQRSLSKFCEKLGFSIIECWDDPDFEPASLSGRVATLRRLPAPPVEWMGKVLVRAAVAGGVCDSRVVLSQRRSDNTPRDPVSR